MLKWVVAALLGIAASLYLAFLGLGAGWFGHHESPGEITGPAVPANVLRERDRSLASAKRARAIATDKQILFGDLHVHTTFSTDAFFGSLPMLNGEGSHPPADACDYARYCSALDFWSINDHAEGMSPSHWQDTVKAIQQCNAVAGDPENPDVVAFLGWEWTQVGRTPESHYGHKNVVLREIADGKVPARPISARGVAAQALGLSSMSLGSDQQKQLSWLALGGREQRYLDFATYMAERAKVANCPEDVNTKQLPPDCHEGATTPQELFRKLDEWGLPSVVIPHGTTWGFYTPAGSSWDKQLNRKQHDPNRQTMIEVFSGHGNSEEFRSFREVEFGANNTRSCPSPVKNYVPSCWRAGEIIRERCRQTGADEQTCEEAAVAARQNYVDAGNLGFRTVPGATISDWLDSGQCRDCFLPSFNYRPRSSVQYMMALTNFDNPADPMNFRFGFMASSDNHKARPGTGYKEMGRRANTEAVGPSDEVWQDRLQPDPQAPVAKSERIDVAKVDLPAFAQVEAERQASFFMTGGLIAVHSEGRSRGAIWDAFQSREMYGTSGDRILLWFDLLNPPGATAGKVAPMGAEVKMSQSPIFQVKAIGAFEQQPGCPQHAVSALKPSRLDRLCSGECYNPSERRKIIRRIEVVRIRPQKIPDEPVEELIDDPWRTFDCTSDPAGCTVTFTDEHFANGGRNALYYVRAIQDPSPTVNGGHLRCEYDSEGNCTKIKPCFGDFRTEGNDDCLAPAEERAWSSPIYVNFGS